ncbi:MAG: lysylphosphatidylglycerol synthase transmembrane domain-containing protein [Bacillales bacterium]
MQKENDDNTLNNETISNIENKKNSKSNIIKYLVYFLVIITLTTIVFISSLWGNSDKIFSLFKQMNWKFFFMLMGNIILINLFNAFCLFLFTRLYYKRYKYHQALANYLIGIFYNDITPGASGGQVAQIYTYNKQGVSVSNSASIMVMMYIVYQTCLITMGILSLFTPYIQDIMDIQTIDLVINNQNIPVPIFIFIILGFLLNLFVILVLFVMSSSEKFHNFISIKFIYFLGKLRLVKNPDKKSEEVRAQVENFRVEFRRLRSNVPFFILMILLVFISLFLSENVPFLCGLSLNGFSNIHSIKDYFHYSILSVVYTNYHQMITGLIPLPGSSGISEFVFVKLFSKYFNAPGFVENGGINAVMLLWRFVTFHIPFLVSGMVAATYKTRGMSGSEILITGDKKTFATIQMQTYDERKLTSDITYLDNQNRKKVNIEKIKNNIKFNKHKTKDEDE